MVEFRILGPLEVADGGATLPLGGQKQRAVLGLLLIRAGELVPSGRIIDELWGEHPPPAAAASLQNLVSQLRKLLGPDVIVTRAPGYLLDVAPEQLDHVRFERMIRAALPLEAAERSERLAEALRLWRGPPLGDLEYHAFAQNEIRRLEELRLLALEGRLGAEIELGSGAQLVAELDALLRENPLHEVFCGQLLLALRAAGRQGDAFRVYFEMCDRLREELGADPGSELEQVYRDMLDPPRRPPRTVPEVDDGEDIARALLGGQLVPVLGWGAGRADGGESDAVDPAAVAERLCRVFGCGRDGTRDLARICQEVALTAGIRALYDELHAIYGRDREPGPAHRLLADAAVLLGDRSLPRQAIVTSEFNGALERAFADAGAELDVVSYIAFGRNQGKFLHVAPDGSETVVEVPNSYTGISPDERTVLMKIHGRVDPSDADQDSFVVSEDDHIDYLSQAEVSSLVPATLVARLRRSHFLFLGYPLRDWRLRVFFNRLWGRDRVGYRSWTVDPARTPPDRELWLQRGVVLVDTPLDAFVDDLRRRLLEGSP